MSTVSFIKKTMEELQRLTEAEAKQTFIFPIVVVLDNVRSMHNVGSVFRTADSLGLQEIVLCGFTPCPPHREIHKTALGATETVKWQYCASVTESLIQLKQSGYIIAAAEQVHNSISLENIQHQPQQKLALIFGNEVEGVSKDALDLCDMAIEIPQFGAKHSLNISVSAGIVIWEMIRNFNKIESLSENA